MCGIAIILTDHDEFVFINNHTKIILLEVRLHICTYVCTAGTGLLYQKILLHRENTRVSHSLVIRIIPSSELARVTYICGLQ